MNFRHYILILILLLITSLFFPLSAKGQWILQKNHPNYKVYLHEDWKENHSYKAEGIYNVSADILYRFLIDFDRYPQWINYCSKAELLQVKKNEHYIYYAFYDLPWPLANREAVTELTIRRDDEGVITVNSSPAVIEFESRVHAILVNEYHESFSLIPINEEAVLFKMQGSYHPGGYIPNWIIRKFLTEGPYDILLNIENQIKRETK